MPIPDGADKEKLAEVALAILWLGAHGDKTATRVWKGVDWQVTDILYEKGWISDPQGKAKSVMLSEEGEKLAQELFENIFQRKNRLGGPQSQMQLAVVCFSKKTSAGV